MSTERSGQSFRPICVAEWDLLDAVPTIPSDAAQSGGRDVSVHLLVRFGTEPLGHVTLEDVDSESFSSIAKTAVMRTFGAEINERLAASELPRAVEIPGAGLAIDPNLLEFVIERRRLLENAPDVSVVLCTRDRPKRVAECIRRLACQEYPTYEIVVVDNAPKDPDAVPGVLRTLDAPTPVRYVVERRGGLSWARNAGWKAEPQTSSRSSTTTRYPTSIGWQNWCAASPRDRTSAASPGWSFLRNSKPNPSNGLRV